MNSGVQRADRKGEGILGPKKIATGEEESRQWEKRALALSGSVGKGTLWQGRQGVRNGDMRDGDVATGSCASGESDRGKIRKPWHQEPEQVSRTDASTGEAIKLEISGFGRRGGLVTAVEVIDLDISPEGSTRGWKRRALSTGGRLGWMR